MDASVSYEGTAVKFCDVIAQDYIEGLLLQGIWYELPNLEFVRSLKAEGNYVDVGAYIGTHTLFFSLFCPSKQVFSFEPQLDVFQKLTRNLEANGVTKCRALNMGLSDAPGRGIVRSGETNKGAGWLLPGDAVEVVTLDSLNLRDVILLKIDVEGMELRVLRGAVNTLKSVQYLFVEMWPEHVCKRCGVDYTVEQAKEFLAPLGFELQPQKLKEDLFFFQRTGAKNAIK